MLKRPRVGWPPPFVIFAILCYQLFVVSAQYPYAWTKGGLELTCDLNSTSGAWTQVGTSCYLIDPNQGLPFNSTLSFCKRTNNSYPARLDNYLIVRELKKADFWRNGLVWTGYYTNDLTSLNSSSKIGNFSVYNPSWAYNEPLWLGNLCVALDISSDDLEEIGWSLQNCSTRLPVLCETFSCRTDQWRCLDNSRCIPESAIHDQIRDCDDGSDETVDLVSTDLANPLFGSSFRKYSTDSDQVTTLRAVEGEILIAFDGRIGNRQWRIENPQRVGVMIVVTGRLPESSRLEISSCNSPKIPIDRSQLPLITALADPCVTISLVSSSQSSHSLHIRYFKGCPSYISSAYATILLPGPFASKYPISSSSPPQSPFLQPTYLTRSLLSFSLIIDPNNYSLPITVIFDEMVLDDASVLTISSPDSTRSFSKNCLSCLLNLHFTRFPVKIFVSSGSGRFIVKLRYSQDCPPLTTDPSLIMSPVMPRLELGSMVEAECPLGSHLTGPTRIECLFGSIWSGDFGQCLEGDTFCPMPAVRNGYPISYDQSSLGIQCRARFTGDYPNFLASFTSFCNGSTWDPPPICRPLNCSAPAAEYEQATLTNTSEPSLWRVYDVAQYSMSSESISVAPFRQCSRTGEWLDFNFKQIDQCPFQVIPFGTLPWTMIDRDVGPNCTDGFQWTTAAHCNSSGIYEEPKDLCNAIPYDDSICGENGQVENHPGGYGCICEENYRFDGTNCKVINPCEDGTSQCDPSTSNCVFENGSYFCECHENGAVEDENHTCTVKTCSRDLFWSQLRDSRTNQFVQPDRYLYKSGEQLELFTGAIDFENGSDSPVYYRSLWQCDGQIFQLINEPGKSIYNFDQIPRCSSALIPNVILERSEYYPLERPRGQCISNGSQQYLHPSYCSPIGQWVGTFYCQDVITSYRAKRSTVSCQIPSNPLMEVSEKRLEIGKFAQITCKYPGYTLSGLSEIGCYGQRDDDCLLDESSDLTIFSRETLTLFCNFRRSCRDRVYWMFDGKRIDSLDQQQVMRDYSQLIYNKHEAMPADSGVYSCVAESSDGKITETRRVRVQILDHPAGRPVNPMPEQEIRLSLAQIVSKIRFTDENWKILEDGRVLRFPFGESSSAILGPFSEISRDFFEIHLKISSNDPISLEISEISAENPKIFENFREIRKFTMAGDYLVPISVDFEGFSLRFTSNGHVLIEDLSLITSFCPELKQGLTTFAPVKARPTSQLIRGSCEGDSIEFHPSFAECLPGGIWNRSRTLASCKCPRGASLFLGECVKRGPKCFDCSNESDCRTVKQCDLGEMCSIRVASYMGTRFTDQRCVKESECARDNEIPCTQDSESCHQCCQGDHCNQIDSLKSTTVKSILSELPLCVDEIGFSIEDCPANLTLFKQGNLWEPIEIPFPKVRDNSPFLKIHTNLPLFSRKILNFRENPGNLIWTLTDLNGFVKSCETKILINETPNLERICPDALIFKKLTPYQPLILPDFGGLGNFLTKPENLSQVVTDSSHFIQVFRDQEPICAFYASFFENPCDKVPPNFVCNSVGNLTRCTQDYCDGIWTHEVLSIECMSNGLWTVQIDPLIEDSTPAIVPKCMTAEPASFRTIFSFALQSFEDRESCAKFIVDKLKRQVHVAADRMCQPKALNFVDSRLFDRNLSVIFEWSASMTDDCTDVFRRLQDQYVSIGLPNCKFEPGKIEQSSKNCPSGSMRQAHLCVECPSGWFLKEGYGCEPCPIGLYSERNGQLSCQKCPPNQLTREEGSSSAKECLDLCPAGFYSRDGLAPCLPCKLGTYQEYPGSTFCTECPRGSMTRKRGSRWKTDCLASCPRGHQPSVSGDCTECPRGSYETQGICRSCPNGLITRKPGSKDIAQCIVDSCRVIGCKNGGSCRENGLCQCPINYFGQDCGLELDLCAANFCENHGNCSYVEGKNRCTCTVGFSGDRCEVKLAEKPPKLNSFKCLNGMPPDENEECSDSNSIDYNPNCQCESGHGWCYDSHEKYPDNPYRCDCQPGYHGRFCEYYLTDRSCARQYEVDDHSANLTTTSSYGTTILSTTTPNDSTIAMRTSRTTEFVTRPTTSTTNYTIPVVTNTTTTSTTNYTTSFVTNVTTTSASNYTTELITTSTSATNDVSDNPTTMTTIDTTTYTTTSATNDVTDNPSTRSSLTSTSTPNDVATYMISTSTSSATTSTTNDVTNNPTTMSTIDTNTYSESTSSLTTTSVTIDTTTYPTTTSNSMSTSATNDVTNNPTTSATNDTTIYTPSSETMATSQETTTSDLSTTNTWPNTDTLPDSTTTSATNYTRTYPPSDSTSTGTPDYTTNYRNLTNYPTTTSATDYTTTYPPNDSTTTSATDYTTTDPPNDSTSTGTPNYTTNNPPNDSTSTSTLNYTTNYTVNDSTTTSATNYATNDPPNHSTTTSATNYSTNDPPNDPTTTSATNYTTTDPTNDATSTGTPNYTTNDPTNDATSTITPNYTTNDPKTTQTTDFGMSSTNQMTTSDQVTTNWTDYPWTNVSTVTEPYSESTRVKKSTFEEATNTSTGTTRPIECTTTTTEYTTPAPPIISNFTCQNVAWNGTFVERYRLCKSGNFDEASGSCLVKSPCDEMICENGGTCRRNSSICLCPKGFNGPTCAHEISLCNRELNPEANRCQNGGECRVDSLNRATYCHCLTGYTGLNCEYLINHCDPNPCSVNSENCTSLLNSRGYFCLCKQGWSGQNCTDQIDLCSVYCVNGKCDPQGSCRCYDGWDGPSCTIPKTECSPEICKNGGVCLNIFSIESRNEHVCSCTDTWGGEDCSDEIRYCAFEPCQNGGTCTDNSTTGYTCACIKPFDGVACEKIGCGNWCTHGKCRTTATDAFCDCDPEWTGAECNIDITEACSVGVFCQNGGTCRNNTRLTDGEAKITGNCSCPPAFTGIYCDMPRDSSQSFNLAYNGQPSTQQIATRAIPYTFLREFTLCGWVRYTPTNPETTAEQPPFISLILSDSFEFLSISDKNVRLNGSRVLSIDLEPFIWRFICVSSPRNITNTDSNEWSVYQDGELRSKQNFPRVNVTTSSGDTPYYTIQLARPRPGIGATLFNGDIGFVFFDEFPLTDEEIREMAFNCSHGGSTSSNGLVTWPQSFTRVDDSNPGITKEYPGICAAPQRDCRRGDPKCSPPKDKIAPTVVECPPLIESITPDRLTEISWTVRFEDNVGVVRVESNFRSGQTFSWGMYGLLVTAYDAADNSATCESKIVVAPSTCGKVQSPTNGQSYLQPVNGTDTKLIAVVSCTAELYPPIHPPFYVCDAMGQWDRWHGVLKDSAFRPPGCGETKRSTQTVNGSLYSDEDCESVYETIQATLNQTLLEYCGQDANENCTYSLENPCLPLGKRLKRAVGETNRFHFEMIVQNSWEYMSPKVEEDLEKSTPLLGMSIDEEIGCPDGFPITHIDPVTEKVACANCPPCQRANADNTACECLCPLGEYCSEGSCSSCPPGKTTYQCSDSGHGVGDCEVICDEGEEVISSDSCAPCPLGQYSSPYPGEGPRQRLCDHCPYGMTTNRTASTSRDDCFYCSAGMMLSLTGECTACPQGTYKEATGESQCTPCPSDGNGGSFTTINQGSTSKSSCTLLASCPKDQRPKVDSRPVVVDPNLPIGSYCQQCAYGTSTQECEPLKCCPCMSPSSCSNVECKPDSKMAADQCDDGLECDRTNYTCVERSTTHNAEKGAPSRWWIGVLVGVGAVCLAAVALFALVMYRNSFNQLMCCGKWRNKEMISTQYHRREPNLQAPRVVLNNGQPQEEDDRSPSPPRWKPRRHINPQIITSDLNPTPYVDYSEQTPQQPVTHLPNRPPPVQTSQRIRNRHPVELSRLPPPIQTQRDNLRRSSSPFDGRSSHKHRPRRSFHDSVSSNRDSFHDFGDDSDDQDGYFE